MSIPTITIIGNLGTDVELRAGASGNSYARVFVIAANRVRNQQTGDWEDGDQLAVGGVMFGQLAENASRSLAKGMRVIVRGRLRQSRPNPNVPDARPGMELLVDDIAPSLAHATAVVTRNNQQAGGFSQPTGGFSQPAANGFQQPTQQSQSFQQTDVWATQTDSAWNTVGDDMEF